MDWMDLTLLILAGVLGVFALGFMMGQKHGIRVQKAIDALKNVGGISG